MTEYQAKQRWCPMYRDFGGNGSRFDFDNSKTEGRCIGSDCMAWRELWGPNYPAGRDEDGEYETYPKGSGYCGLAGRP